MVIYPIYELWTPIDFNPAHFGIYIPAIILLTLFISMFLFIFVEYPFMKKRIKFLQTVPENA